MRPYALTLAVALLNVALFPQAIPLKEAHATPLDAAVFRDAVGQVKCDSQHRLYFRVATLSSSSVVRIDPDDPGSQTRYTLDNSAGMEAGEKWAINDFAPGPDGNVFFLATLIRRQAPGEASGRAAALPAARKLIEFDEDGQYQRTLELSIPLLPMMISAFNNGDLLVMGKTIKEGPLKVTLAGPTVLAIFDSSGRFLRYVHFDLQKLAGTHGDSKSKTAKGGKPPADPAQLLNLAQARPADDGNIYIALTGSSQTDAFPGSARIAVLSPGGEILRTLDLAGPAHSELLRYDPAGGKVAAEFGIREADEHRAFSTLVLRVFDSSDGQVLGEYSGLTSLICYDGSSFFALQGGDPSGPQVVELSPN